MKWGEEVVPGLVAPCAGCDLLFYNPVFSSSLTVYCSAANKHLVINDKQGNLRGRGAMCSNILGVLQNACGIRWLQICF